MTNIQHSTDLAGKRRPGEALIFYFLFFAASVSILTTVGIVGTLGKEAFPFFTKVSVWEFLTNLQWQPQIDEFGILRFLPQR
jgi:phosphate transport system permease protein